MRLVSAVLARNEEGRYLERVLASLSLFSDQILVLDDHSTDKTYDIAVNCPKAIAKHRPTADAAWGAESSARQELWERGAKLAKDGWLLICDSDMILHGDPRPLCLSWECTSWAWTLRDLWDGEDTYRVDGPWGIGPQAARPWLFKPSACPSPQWSGRGIHSFHAPLNFPGPCFQAPTSIFWLHYAYLTRAQREKKCAQYMSIKEQLTPFELQHASSIVD